LLRRSDEGAASANECCVSDVRKSKVGFVRKADRRLSVTKPTTYRAGPTPKARDYTVSASQHAEWCVYVLELSNKKAVKVGMSHDPNARLKHYNHSIMPEITGLCWKLSFAHPVRNAKAAQEVEQAVLRSFAEHQLPSNGEILQDVEVKKVKLAIISAAGSID